MHKPHKEPFGLEFLEIYEPPELIRGDKVYTSKVKCSTCQGIFLFKMPMGEFELNHIRSFIKNE